MKFGASGGGAAFRAAYEDFLASLPIDAVGLAAAAPSLTFCRLAERFPALPPNLAYLSRNAQCREHLDGLCPSASGRPKTVISCLIALEEMPPCTIANGFARYCVCGDYHKVLRDRLGRLRDFLSDRIDFGAHRICVDTAPLLEREWAVRAGLGHIGFNRMLSHAAFGSHVMLGEILAEKDLMPYCDILRYHSNAHCIQNNTKNDAPNASNEENAEYYAMRCTPGQIGCCPPTRRRCALACPTGALSEAGYDASLCLSYWSTQHRGMIPDDMARAMGCRLWGCDACQNACPHARRAPKRPVGATPLADLTFGEIFSLSGKALSRRLTDTPLGDAAPAMIVRNACIVLANARNAAYNDCLARVAQNHPTDWARETARKALRILAALNQPPAALL